MTIKYGHNNEPMFRKTSFLKHFLMLLLVVGVTEVWGQTPDYSGTYYIKSESAKKKTPGDYYLCPTEGWIYYQATNTFIETDNGQPFLTTYQCKSDGEYNVSKAKWKIEKSGDFYTIRNVFDGKYMVYNGQISNANANRIRVHLATVVTPDDKELFVIGTNTAGNIVISPKNNSKNYFNVCQGNINSLAGSTDWVDKAKNDGPTTPTNHQNDIHGTIGLYTGIDDPNAPWSLEDILQPVFEQQNDNTIVITCPGCSIYYTTDGSTPDISDESQLYTAPVTMTGPIMTIKVIAVKPAGQGEALGMQSRCITYTTERYIGSSYPYLIQSVAETNYYLQPSEQVEYGFNKTTTSSIARPIMQWYFTNAGVDNGKQYYYIVNQNNLADPEVQATEYIYYHQYTSGSNNLFLISRASASDFDESNKFKFTFSDATEGGYNILPKLNTARCFNKYNGNTESSAVQASQDKTNARSRWNILPAGDYTRPSAPINVSIDHNANYYAIGSVSRTDTYLVTGTDCASSSTSTGDDRAWFVREASHDDWNTYFHIINAETGKYLYLAKTTTWNTDSYTLKDISEIATPEDADRIEFLLPKNTEDNLYIVSKYLQDNSIQYYTGLALRKNVANPQTIPIRKDGDHQILWSFTTTTFTCAAPEVSYDEVSNQIVISSPQGADVYYAIDGGDNTFYESPIDNTNTGSTRTISAVCARRTDQSDASSAVTIISNPTITLVGDASITYDGSGHQPEISSVKIGETPIASSEYSPTPIYVKDGVVVSNCRDAGVYTVVVTDAVGPEGENYFVYGTTTFTINQASLTITPNDGQSKGYGDPDPVLTYTSSGLLGSDELTGALSRVEGETVGTYAITQGTLGNTNYTATFTTGRTFEIAKKSLGDGIGSNPAPNITCTVTKDGGTYSVVVLQGTTPLTLNGDYIIDSDSEGDKYYKVNIRYKEGSNYTGGFTAKVAKIKLSKPTESAVGGAALFVSDEDDGNFVVPSYLTAYIVTGINGNTLVTEGPLDNIPEQKPVLLVTDINTDGFQVFTTTGTAPSGTNLLKEVKDDPSKHFDTAAIYLLYKGEFVLNMEGDLAKGKIYLDKSGGPSPAPVKLYIDWDLMDGIDLGNEELRIKNEEFATDKNWYTLDGRRLDNSKVQNSKMPKGVYIVNGKKVIINN